MNCTQPDIVNLATLISAIVVLVQIFNWRTAEKKRKQDLYDKRIIFYDEFLEFFDQVMKTGDAYPDPNKISLMMRKSYFLFGEDVANFLEKIRLGQINLEYANKDLKSHSGLVNEYNQSAKTSSRVK